MRSAMVTLVVAATLASCASAPREELLAAMDRNDLVRAHALAIEALESSPNGRFVRYDLAWVYFAITGEWLRQGKDVEFVHALASTQEAYLEILDEGVRNQVPHMGLGMLLSMANEPDGALTEFRIACVLAPYAPCYANLTRVHIYRGELDLASQARHALDTRQKSLQRPALFAQVDILMAWKKGDLAGARAAFARAAEIHSFAGSWRGDKLDPPLGSFEDFAAQCCRRFECGTGMADSCRSQGLQPAVVQHSADTLAVLEEIADKRNRRLRRLYVDEPDVLLFVPVDPAKPQP